MSRVTGLPSGTVTMLFSDIEGSTRMVHALGEAWPALLAQQRQVCREVWSRHSGHELATEGDSFFVVFADADDAVAAAVEAQRLLGSTAWTQGAEVRVRIGLHTGAPARLEDGYAGLDVHRAARVAAVAHGGQVLASAETVDAAGLGTVSGPRALDLGWHQLKDLPDRMRLYQLTQEGLPATFPPIRSRGTLGGLPATSGPIIGRDAEIGELSDLVKSAHRLVTLTGPGGSGKTRLATAVAVEVADQFADGVHFVPLVSASDAGEAWSEIGRVLGLRGDPLEQVDGLDALLVLDNLEQCVGADDLARELLTRAPGVSVLATSRRALHVDGERELAVQPLALEPGVELFVARATSIRPTGARDDVEELVRRLDGLPLAIEIAAARTRVLSPKALLARLDDVLDVSGHRPDARQRTIRSTIAWSYDLLSDDQQRLLDCLGVFVGGASLPAIASVSAPEDLPDLLDVLFGLVDANLVQVSDTDDGEPRFSLLEAVRIFAQDRLDERGVRTDREARHAQYFYDLVARHWDERQALNHAHTRAEHLREVGNLRAVVSRSARGVHHARYYGDEEVPTSHVVTLFAMVTGAAFLRFADAQAWVQAGLELPGLDDPARAALLHEQGYLEARIGDSRAALVTLGEAAGIATPLGDLDLPLWVDPVWRLFLIHRETAHAHMNLGESDLARQACRRVLDGPVPVGPEQVVIHELPYLIAVNDEEFDEARTHLEREGQLIRELGMEREQLMWVNNMADLDVETARHEDARRRLSEHCEAYIAQGDLDLLQYALSTFAAAIGPVDEVLAARAYGAADGIRVLENLPLAERDHKATDAQLRPTRDSLGPARWEAEVEIGRRMDVAVLLRELSAVSLRRSR